MRREPSKARASWPIKASPRRCRHSKSAGWERRSKRRRVERAHHPAIDRDRAAGNEARAIRSEIQRCSREIFGKTIPTENTRLVDVVLPRFAVGGRKDRACNARQSVTRFDVVRRDAKRSELVRE